MTTVGNDVYAILITPATARATRLDVTAKQLSDQVKALRETISTVENGQRVTYAFDVALSHQMYGELFGPFAAEVGAAKHLIFEPDGALLRLPPNLLVMDQASVDAYAAAREDERRCGLRLPRNRLARPRPRHQHLRQPTLLRAAAKRAALRREERISGAWRRTRRRRRPRKALVPAAADRDCIAADLELGASDFGQGAAGRELDPPAL